MNAERDACRVAIRVDASEYIGAGHVARCLTLAEALRRRSAEVTFICRRQPGDCVDWIKDSGFPVLELPRISVAMSQGELVPDDVGDTLRSLRPISPLNWLVVDHYGIDFQWQKLMRSCTARILVIDDLANREHDCDFLLDQNLYLNAEHRYVGLLPSHCKTLLGPKYAILRDEFYQVKRSMRHRSGVVRNLLCFYGASDPTGETFKALSAIQMFSHQLWHVDVVVGNTNPRREHVAALCNSLPMTTYHCQTSKMAELCATADIALGAGGFANWERSFLGLPSLVTITAGNQKETTNAVASVGGIRLLGESKFVDAQSIAVALQEVIDEPGMLAKLSENALSIMGDGGNSGAKVVAESILYWKSYDDDGRV